MNIVSYIWEAFWLFLQVSFCLGILFESRASLAYLQNVVSWYLLGMAEGESSLLVNIPLSLPLILGGGEGRG